MIKKQTFLNKHIYITNDKIKHFVWTHPVCFSACFFGLYILLFAFAEIKEPMSVTLIGTELDYLIPFSKYAVILYCTWHIEIVMILLSFLLCRDLEGYWLMAAKLLSGLFVILIICCVFPNMIDLRPVSVEGNDIFACLTRLVYTLDNNRNVFPSGHAMGAVLMAAGWCRIANNKWQRAAAWLLNIGIIFSTLLLKQHSIIDAAGGIVLAFVLELIWEWIAAGQKKEKYRYRISAFMGLK